MSSPGRSPSSPVPAGSASPERAGGGGGDLGTWPAAVVRLASLQRVTARLVSTRSVAEVAAVVLEEAMQALEARFAYVGLLDVERREFRAVGWAGADTELMSRWQSYPNSPDLPAGRAAREGVPVLMRSVAERDALFPALVGAAAVDESFACVPLIVGDQVLGCVSFGWPQPRSFEPDDVAFLQILASQCAEALNRALDYERARRAAEVLQRSVLPTRLPQPDWLQIAVRYHPAGGDQIGGDFYDVFTLPDGRIGAFVGDVSGHGLAAAAMTSLIRHTIRAEARHHTSPAATLQATHTALVQADRGGQYCTVAYLILTPPPPSQVSTPPPAVHVACALAGHPQPLRLTRDGASVPIGRFGTPLGLLDAATITDSVTTLNAGDRIILYTDGYLEVPTLGGRIDTLPPPATTPPAGTVDDMADQLQTRALDLQHGRPHDDMALIVLARPMGPTHAG